MMELLVGLVCIEVQVYDGVVELIICGGLFSYIDIYCVIIYVLLLGNVIYSVVYSGGFYVLVDVIELGFYLILDEEVELVCCVCVIVEVIQVECGFFYYILGDVGLLLFLYFMGLVEQVGDYFYCFCFVIYVYFGVICCSIIGIGIFVWLVLMYYEGRIKFGDWLEIVFLCGFGFIGEFIDICWEEDYEVVENIIIGKSYVLVYFRIVVNCEDLMVDCGGLYYIFSDSYV